MITWDKFLPIVAARVTSWMQWAGKFRLNSIAGNFHNYLGLTSPFFIAGWTICKTSDGQPL